MQRLERKLNVVVPIAIINMVIKEKEEGTAWGIEHGLATL
jgi:hypothetical protein